jgi:hypothetical protein
MPDGPHERAQQQESDARGRGGDQQPAQLDQRA